MALWDANYRAFDLWQQIDTVQKQDAPRLERSRQDYDDELLGVVVNIGRSNDGLQRAVVSE